MGKSVRPIAGTLLAIALAGQTFAGPALAQGKGKGATVPASAPIPVPNPTPAPEPVRTAPPPTPRPSAPLPTALPTAPDARWQALMTRAERAYHDDYGDAMGEAAAEALAIAEARWRAGDVRIARSLTIQGIWHLVESRHAEAEPVLRRAVEIIDAAGARDSIAGAAALDYLGESRMMQGDYVQAETLMREALAISQRRGGPGHDQTARTAMTLGFLLQWTNRPAEAQALLLPARAAAQAELGRGHRQVLQLGSAIGALYMLQGRRDDAVREYRAALADAEAGLRPDHGTTNSLAANLSSILAETGRHAEAEALLRRAIAGGTRNKGADHGEVLGHRIALAGLVATRGDFLQGERLAREVLATIEQRYSGDHPQLVGTLETLALIANLQARNAEALALQQRAVETRRRVEGPDAMATLNSELLLADFLTGAGRLDEAEPLYRSHVAAMTRALGPDNPATLSSEIKLAQFLSARGDHAAVLPLAQAMVPRAESTFGRSHAWTINLLWLTGWSHWGLGQLDPAHRVMSDALSRSIASLGRADPMTTMVASSLAYLRIEMPQHHAQAVEPAQLVADALRNRQRREGSNSDILAQNVAAQSRATATPSLTLIADALWVSRGTDGNGGRYILQAFEALQNATAGGTDQAVLRTAARQVAATRGPDLAALVERREAAEARWAEANAALTEALAEAGSAADGLRQQRRAEQQAVEQELAAIDTQLRSRFPDYFALIRPEPISQQVTQSMLAPDEAVLMIVPTDYGTHVMALNSSDGTWVRADITANQIDWSVRRLLFDLGAPVEVSMSEAADWQAEGGRGYPFSRRNAWILYTHLIQPVARILEGKRHVFVVTSGSLTSLPLGVLVTEEPTGADGDPASLRSTRWLADRHALIRMPTLQALHLQRRLLTETAGNRQARGFTGFGDPLLDGQPALRSGGRGATRSAATSMADAFAGSPVPADGSTHLANVAQLKRMARLPGTATELANMRSALGAPATSVRLGAAATESAIRSADLSQTRILALATHGLMAGEIDGAIEPGLVFTPPQQATPGDDGLLTASEIAGLRLNAEWVILSACNTAAGDGSEGAPGLSGLAQAFFFAGARTLLASHWPVRDDVASRITVRTIEIQRDQPALSRAEAFQRAMQEIRNDASHDTSIDTWAHPNAWAPFTLIGDGAQ